MNSVSFNISSIEAAREAIESQKKDIFQAALETVQELIQIGEADATQRFANALYAGTNDVEVNSRITNAHGHKVVGEVEATGDSALFIEYGTGIGPVEPPHVAGEYGKGRGANPPWYYYGEQGNTPDTMVVREDPARGSVVRTFGNPANLCLHLAKQTVEEEIERRSR